MGDDVNASLTLSALSVSLSSFVGLLGTGRVSECGIGLIAEGKLGYTMCLLDFRFVKP